MDLDFIAIVMIGLIAPISCLLAITSFRKDGKYLLGRILTFIIPSTLYIVSVLYILFNAPDPIDLVWVEFSLLATSFSIVFFSNRSLLHPSSKFSEKSKIYLLTFMTLIYTVAVILLGYWAKVSGIPHGVYGLAFSFYTAMYLSAFLIHTSYRRFIQALTTTEPSTILLSEVRVVFAVAATIAWGISSYACLLESFEPVCSLRK